MSIVTITTDFGTKDGYVGEVKGVLATRAPEATLVDVAHDVRPGDVRGAAWILGRIWSRFAARVAERWFVGPDNGLLTFVRRAFSVEEARRIDLAIGGSPPSNTFHGRDVFAPAAAHLAAGGDPRRIGAEIERERIVELALPRPARQGDSLRGHVLHVDRFGNLITNLPNDDLPPSPQVLISGVTVPTLSPSYDAVGAGELLASLGSGGTLEIAVRDGSASERLGVERDEEVEVRPSPGAAP
jgi:S-adenosylmethionine hydrolase